MSNAKLINKSDINSPPEYTAADEALSPMQQCMLNEEEKEPIQRVIKAYFTDLEGNPLEKITKEEEVYLAIETENMEGEELIVNLPEHENDFEFMEEVWDGLKAIKLKITSALEKIKLTTRVNPDRFTPPDTPTAAPPDEEVTDAPAGESAKDEDANIVSVEFLDGTDDKILSSGGDQYVNLPYEDKWVDGTIIKNKDRLSRKPRIKVKFDKPGGHSFKIKLIPDGANVVYSAKEKGRNSNFKYEEKEKSYSTDGDGTKIIDDLFVAVAGNDKYSLSATDLKGKTVKSSGKIMTKRFFHYIEIKMKGLKAVATSLATFESEFKRNFMKVEALSAVEMKHMENISTTDSGTFKSLARKAYDTSADAKNKQPYCVAVGYTDHLAVKNSGTIEKTGVELGGAKSVPIKVKGKGLKVVTIKERALWNDLVTGESWFVSCQYKADGAATWKDIPEAKCKAVQKAGYPKGYCNVVEVDVSSLPKGKGTIRLKVNWVDRMRGGLSFPGGSLVCICTRAWWQDKNTTSQNQVLIHEVGHKVGMVADGSGNLPDKVATHYADKGHVGDHCYNGNPAGESNYNTSAFRKNSVCVMFGTGNGKTKFCGNCHPTVRKLDITKGWSKF